MSARATFWLSVFSVHDKWSVVMCAPRRWLYLGAGHSLRHRALRFPFFLSIVIRVLISIAVCLALYWLTKLTKTPPPLDAISEVRALVPPLTNTAFLPGIR